MKLLSAVIKPLQLDALRQALAGIGVQGVTVTDVKGFGQQKGHSGHYRGREYEVDFRPRLEVEVAVEEGILDRAIDAIRTSARTGTVADGEILVSDLEKVIRIRTGEIGKAAL